MGCCGKKRAQASSTANSTRAPDFAESAPAPRALAHDSLAYFQYFGDTGLTVRGPITGKRYRFNSPGEIVAVDLRDRRALAAVSTLREVRKANDAR